MKLIVLCGGQGTRIREAAELKPKPMLEIGGRPILWHIMKLYAHHGHQDFVLALGYLGYQIKQFFLNYKPMVSDFTVHLGSHEPPLIHSSLPEQDWSVTCADTGANAMTGARVKRSAKYLEGGDEDFMVTYGDGLGDVDIQALLKFHKAHGRLGTVCGVRPAGRFGELELEGGKVKAFNEKPQATGGYINGGFMAFKRAFVERYLNDSENLVLERDPMMRLAHDGELMMYPHDGFWQPMDTFREYQMLNDMWASGKAPWKLWKGD